MDRVERGKFRRDIEREVGIKRSTAYDYMQEASEQSGVNFANLDDEGEFSTGPAQNDTHAEKNAQMQKKEKRKAKAAELASQGLGTISFNLPRIPVVEREKFTTWKSKKEHKNLLDIVMRHVVNCILDVHIGPQLVMRALENLIADALPEVTSPPAAYAVASDASQVTVTATLVSDAAPIEEAPAGKGKKLTFLDGGDDLL